MRPSWRRRGGCTSCSTRTLRTTFREARGQTPVTYGEPAPGFVVADLAGLREQGQANSDPRLQSLKRGALRAESNEWELQVSRAVEEDDELAATVRRLEEAYDDELLRSESGEA